MMQTHPPVHLHDDTFDVAIIGGGVVGCAMARRFTLEGARVALIEKAPDILDGASKANSAILHTGFDAPEGSLELQCIKDGHAEYAEIRAGLDLPLDPCGAYVVAWTPQELANLDRILAKAHENGVTDTEIIPAMALHQLEPNLAGHALGAVHVPGESLIDPWSAPYVYLRQALENGAETFLSCEVTGGDFDGRKWQINTTSGRLKARTILNCAGLYGDLLDQALLGASNFNITPRKGQFVVFDKAASNLLNAVILPVPTARTKGIVLFRTIFGNLAVGPTAEDQESRVDASTDTATLEALIEAAHTMLPALKPMPVTATYAGLRPASEFKDYQISTTPEKNWITVGGIRSTGLSGALGIARHVFGLYENMGHSHSALSTPAMPKATVLAQSGKRDWTRKTPGEIVCHCELVTRREIEAALSGPLPARSLAGLKRQTRATMGRCQGFYCSARLAELTDGHFTRPLAEKIKP
jgi:glycerol-3-phosphate dehydrogenase